MSTAVKPGPDFVFDPPKPLFESGMTGYDVSADGSRFLAIIPDRNPGKEPFTVVVNWPAAGSSASGN
jgi:hypothetical protein